MKKPIPTFVFSLLMLISFSACNNPSGSNDDPDEYIEINSWIHANMEAYYYWNEEVPEEPDGNMTPFYFFESMLEQDDRFSFISDDAQGLLDRLSGSSFTTGLSPAFGGYQNSNNVFIVVEFVYPNTPAEKAGLKRGDIILEINGTQLTTENYQNLYYQGSDATYTLGTYNPDDDTITPTSYTVTVEKAQLSLDPVVYTDIIENGAHKIGYLFYAEFLNGPNDIFIQSVDTVLSNFQQAGITDLVIDLRYNPGGRLSAAINLANTIAPPAVTENEEVFIRYEYNDFRQNYYENRDMDSPNLVSRFSSDPVNLNLDRVYFLATSSSASASELLINGLNPYMEVISIGTPTFGKFYGSYLFTGMNTEPSHNYAIIPVTFKYANADGFSDFRDGLQPTYEAEEDLRSPYPIGDKNDPLFGKALSLITGESQPPAKVLPGFDFEKLPDTKSLKTGNILFEKSPDLK